jgi:hypothetical protein
VIIPENRFFYFLIRYREHLMRVKESQYLHGYCIENPIPILMSPGNLRCFMPHCSPRRGVRTTLLIK